MKKFLFREKHFWTLFFPCFLILLVTSLLSCMLLFNNLQENGQRITRMEQETDTRILTEELDIKFKSMYMTCQRMSNLRWIWSVVADHLPGVMEIRDIVSEFPFYSDNGATFNTVCVAFPQQHIIVSRWGWFQLDDFWRFTNSVNPAVQQSINQTTRFAFVQAEPVTIQGTSYIWISQTMNTGAVPRVQIIFLVNRLSLQSSIADLLPANVTGVEILDAQEQRVAQVYTVPDTQKNDESVQTVNSSFSGWSYRFSFSRQPRVITPSDVFLFLLPFLLALLIGPFISYGLTSISYYPVRRLLKKLPGSYELPENAKWSEYTIVERYMQNMAKDNSDMKRRMEEYQSYTVNGLLQQLLSGYFESNDTTTRFREWGLPYVGSTTFAVLLVAADTGEMTNNTVAHRSDLILMMLADELLAKIPFDNHSLRLPQEGLVVILSDNQNRLNEKNVSDAAALIRRECTSLGERVIVCEGTVESGFIGVSVSYQRAQEQANYYRFPGSVGSYPEGHEQTYYYPTDWQIQLINNLKMAKEEPVQKILNELRSENERHNLSARSYRSLLCTMHDTICRVAEELYMSDLKQSVDEQSLDVRGEEVSWEWIAEACHKICQRSVYRSRCDTLGTQMVQYVDAHFADCEMSLKEVAARFDSSVPTVSHLFKEAAGLNFSGYLLRLRMEQAKMLMQGEKMEMRHLAAAVGYDNRESFKRAFTRYAGVSPKEYRSQMQNDTYLNGDDVSSDEMDGENQSNQRGEEDEED